MGVIAYNEEDVKLLARLMRAEAEGEGQQGMLMVGNVGVNRVRGNCLDFKIFVIYVKWCIKILVVLRQLKKVILSTCKGTRYRISKANDSRTTFLACKFCLMVFRPEGACPPTWYNQQNSGRFKSTASSSQMLGIALAYIKE